MKVCLGPFAGLGALGGFRIVSEKKCLAVPKKIERGDSLVSPGMICYAEKQVKPFWSSSLGQMVLFDTIIFCRTFKNYFGQFVWIEKKRVTIIVAFHFMKRRLITIHRSRVRKVSIASFLQFILFSPLINFELRGKNFTALNP